MPLQTIVVYMKLLKETPIVVGWAIGNFTPISHQQQLRRHAVFLNFACRLHVIISRQVKCKTFVTFKSLQRVLYCTPNLFKYFKLGQNTPSIFRVSQASEIMIVCKYIFFFKRLSVKFYIWKSNRLFSIHWASPLEIAQCQNRGYESEKMTLKQE